LHLRFKRGGDSVEDAGRRNVTALKLLLVVPGLALDLM
jgi:hypothetical protein